ncbi:molecular chaperone HscC [Herbaspirillum rubrisubalbicans]|uniref:Molecular chaperone HscC n=1 Tax=Herbaspirillum rubrisubalbicans Os34 TaxID=1235827 RepID=A0A6M3ZPR7_9BURK|nr:molecular chaperone HscC [Herbaspirillum rubrisubalbicans]QJQ00526.1 molecular chaperone HscC [Herbaspirillum rubrisubalbicans Os34]
MIIAIDLGTTNSLVAVWRNGQAEIIPNGLGEHLTPSCIGVDDDGSLLVGKAAQERLQTHPELSTSLFKRYMGSDKRITLGNKIFRPEELSSIVLRALKADAEAYLGEPVSEAVITVPAYFSDAQRKATRHAGQLAGLKVDSLLNEPTAAALAFGMHQQQAESKFLIFDLGGGTFDVSILELFDGVMEVRATAGDNFLGGEDFLQAMTLDFLKRSGLGQRLGGVALDPRQSRKLREEMERGKRALSEQATTTLRVHYEGDEYRCELDEDTLARLAEPLLERLRQPVERAMRDARIRTSELDKVVLAGGATRMPLVRKLVSRMFGRFPDITVNPDEVVVLGAAVQAGLKMRDAALQEIVLTDVAPYSLGISTSRQVGPSQYTHGHYLPIIERNTVIPSSRVQNVATIRDNQEEVDVQIYQGESRLVADNISLGQISVPIPKRKAGEVSLDIRFTYDINGILEVEVKVLGSDEVHKLVILESPGVMTQAQIEQRLAELGELKIHPRDQMQTRTLLARADRLYEQSLGERRQFLSQIIARYQAVLETQDSHLIRKEHVQLSQILDQIEQESVL